MKAVIHKGQGGVEVLSWEEAPDPSPGAGEVLVRVHASALNRADLLQRKGLYAPPKGITDIPGLEIAGEVLRTGEGVKRWQPGDRVCGLLAGGGQAEMALVHEGSLLPIPGDLTMTEAAALPEVFFTAYQGLFWLAGLQSGETVLIHAGASGVGSAAIQLAVARGARVLVTASKGKHALCRALGAELAIDYQTQDFQEAVQGHLPEDQGVDVVLDFIGAPYFERNLRLLNTDGRLILLAFMGGARPEGGIDLARLLRKRLRIAGSTLRARSLSYKQELAGALEREVWPWLESGTVRPVIDRVLPIAEIREAHRVMEANANQGKIVLQVRE